MHKNAGEQVTLVVLLSLLLVAGATEMAFPMDYIVAIVPGIRSIFNSACVFLIHDLQTVSSLQHLQKELSKRDVSTATVFYQKLNLSDYSYLCRKTLPLYVVLYADEEFRSFLIQLSKTTQISVATWLLFDAQESLDLEEVYADVNVAFDCEFLVAHSINNTVLFTEIHRIDKTWPITTFGFGNWTSSSGLQWVNNDFYTRRDSLHGYVIKATYRYNCASTKEVVDEAERSGEGNRIFVADVFAVLEHYMNFTTRYHIPPDNSYGVVSPNGSWNGMMNLLVKGKVDMGIGTFIIIPTRVPYVDFTSPHISMRSRLFIKKPDSVERKWADFLAPLSNSLWIAFACTMVVLAAFLSGTNSLSRRFGVNLAGSSRYTFLESLYFLFGCFCQQGHEVTPKSLACRIVYFTSYVIAVILLAAYSAALISFLTVQRIVLPFTTFQSMLDVGNYRLGIMAKSAHLNYFDDSTNPVLQEVYRKLVQPYLDSQPKSELEGLLRICSEDRYTFLTPLDTPFSRADLPCVMLEVPRASFSGSISLAMSKRHRFLGIFSHYLNRMRRTGVLRRLHLKAWPRKHTDLTTPWSSVSMEEVQAFFHLLVAGIALSVLVLVGELKLRQSEEATTNISLRSFANRFRVGKWPLR